MKQISRRKLLKLAAGVAAATALPAAAAKQPFYEGTIHFDPPLKVPAIRRGLLTPTIIVREMILQLSEYNEIPVGLLERPGFDSRLGDLVRVNRHKPAMLQWQKAVTWQSTSADLVLSLDDYSEKFVQPAARSLTSDMLDMAKREELGQGVMVMGQLPLHGQLPFAAVANWAGYAARLVRDYSLDTDEMLMRIDLLYGFTTRT